MATVSWSRSPWGRRVLLALIVAVAFPTVLFGLRAYHSLLVLRSAYELGAPQISSVRAWMTIRYVAGAHRAPEAALIAQLQLAPGTDPDTELKSLAEREGVPKVEFVQRVQQALVAVAPALAAPSEDGATSWLGDIGEEFLAALLHLRLPRAGAHPAAGRAWLAVADRGIGGPRRLVGRPGAHELAVGRRRGPGASKVRAAGKRGGTGLGLTIERSVAEAHGGRLVPRSRADKGLEAVLTLLRTHGALAHERGN